MAFTKLFLDAPGSRGFKSQETSPAIRKRKSRTTTHSSDIFFVGESVNTSSEPPRIRTSPTGSRPISAPQLSLKMDAGPPMRFKCTLCLVSLPSQAQLNKHLRGKDHLKKEVRGVIEKQDLEDCKKIIDLLEQKIQENEKELVVCRHLHAMDKQQLMDSVAHCQRNHMSRAAPCACDESFEGKKEPPAPQPVNEAAARATISTASNHPAYLGARPKGQDIVPNYTKYGAHSAGP